jgi:hypothetical protein
MTHSASGSQSSSLWEIFRMVYADCLVSSIIERSVLSHLKEIHSWSVVHCDIKMQAIKILKQLHNVRLIPKIINEIWNKTENPSNYDAQAMWLQCVHYRKKTWIFTVLTTTALNWGMSYRRSKMSYTKHGFRFTVFRDVTCSLVDIY